MSSSLNQRPTRRPIVYPDRDGKRMADNTLQWNWMVTIKGGLEVLFKDDPMVFVASDNLWYPVEGEPKIRLAPDVYVVFGRPKGDRGSYRQWVEDGIALHVVFEILAPGNRAGEMRRKFQFYERYGVEEYYVFDPDHQRLSGWLRSENQLQPIQEMDGWVSPRLQIRFVFVDGVLQVLRPDGQRFLTQVEQGVQAEQTRLALQKQTERVSKQSEQLGKQSEQLERLAAQLRALGVNPDVGTQ